MLLAFGWAIVQSSQAGYLALDPMGKEVDVLDEQLKISDSNLQDELRNWLINNADTWLTWQFTKEHNNHSGLLQFNTSRNHRGGTTIWPLINFIAKQSSGSYGIVFVHDDKDERSDNSFKVWRILDGLVTEHDDPYFSPFHSPNAFGGYTDFFEKG